MKTSRKDGVSLVEHVEQLGDESKHNQQAQDFLAETETCYEVRYIKLGKHFPDDADMRDCWEIRLSRKGREYAFQYGASLASTWERVHKLHPVGTENNAERNARYIMRQWENGDINDGGIVTRKRQKAFEEELKDFTTGAHYQAPTAYDVLACLQAYEPPTDFDDFIAEYGYEITSKESYETALTTFEKVVEEYTSLCTLFSNDEMEALNRIS